MGSPHISRLPRAQSLPASSSATRRRALAVIAGFALAACGSPNGEGLDPAATYTSFGHPFEPAAALPVQAVLAEPSTYAGGAIMIEGLAAKCTDASCWLKMTFGDTAEVRILTPDFAVPDTVAGRRIVVHGSLGSPDSVAADTTTLDPRSSTLELRPTGLMVEKVR